MFESSILNVLKNDNEFLSYVSTYKEEPSIFSNSAPENVDFPYVVFSINNTSDEDSVVDAFNVLFNYFDFSYSGKKARLATKRIVELLDRQHLNDDYYDTIRFFHNSINFVERGKEEDPRAQHYNLRFTARAGRSGWMINTLT